MTSAVLRRSGLDFYKDGVKVTPRAMIQICEVCHCEDARFGFKDEQGKTDLLLFGTQSRSEQGMSEFLKCDAAGCDHIEDVVEITAEMVGRPCPKCGANLLTSEDFDFYSTVMKPGMAAMEALGISRPATSDDPEHFKMRVHGHNRELRIKLPPPPNPHSEKVE